MALSFSDYDGLVDAVAHTLNRTDLADEIPGWILLAEDRHRTDVRIREMLIRIEQEIDGRLIALPTGYLEMRRLRVLAETNTLPYTCEQITSDQMTDKWRSAAQGPMTYTLNSDRPINLPRYFAIDDQIEFEVDPSEYDATNPLADMLYYKQLTPLSETAPTNALLTRAPGAYFYGTLIHSAPFLGDDTRIEVWVAGYNTIVTQINALDRKRSGPLASRVTGATP